VAARACERGGGGVSAWGEEARRRARANPLLRERALAAGAWVEAAGGGRVEVTDPASGVTLASVPRCGATEVEAAVGGAVGAMEGWRALLPRERARALRRWFDLIAAHRAPLAELITLECGKPLAEALGEVDYGAGFVEWYAEEARRAYGEVIPTYGHGRRLLTLREPVGVVAAITPWNFPLAMITRKCAPALAAGCAVVLKPAERTPLTALALAALALEAGLPPALLSVLTSDRAGAAEVGGALCDDPRVRKLTFTGSTAVGKWLMARCAPTVKRLSLELGGDAPLIVFEDADLTVAARGVMASKFRNSGQTCVCANRLLVHRDRHDALAALLTAQVSALRPGHGLDPSVTQGPLISPDAVARVSDLVTRSTALGARALTGGAPLPHLGPHFYAPTLLTGVTSAQPICGGEIFGPIAPLITFTDDDEALRLANSTRAGLAAYVFTTSERRAWRAAEALEVGMVALNDGALSTEVAPFGGVKESGLGREGGRQGLEEFLEVKYLMVGGL
jgi:succinate-semialdehyde dehydrogenase/glutarate-semialdehyde dehydrogenase